MSAQRQSATATHSLFALCFRSDAELDGFVGLLREFLNRPGGRRYRAQPDRLEAWRHVDSRRTSWPACLYVSDVAFVAGQAAGLEVAVGDGISRYELPPASVRVL